MTTRKLGEYRNIAIFHAAWLLHWFLEYDLLHPEKEESKL